MDTLEHIVLPMYYSNQPQWLTILKKAAGDIVPAFESGRLADEYYEKMYN
jgi:starch phosphorylase